MRKLDFSVAVALGSLCSMLAIAASCNKPANKCVTSGAVAEISGDAAHTLEIPADHVKRGLGGMYSSKGGDHEHVIALKDEDMKKLAAGTPVETRTTSVSGHVHEARIRCKD